MSFTLIGKWIFAVCRDSCADTHFNGTSIIRFLPKGVYVTILTLQPPFLRIKKRTDLKVNAQEAASTPYPKIYIILLKRTIVYKQNQFNYRSKNT